ncbi:MAG TPA: hypothetical protein VE990_18630 [Acidimicrobiales bacterium]|nr:hypothetical protein [Acidimicrobiales bacterium]
MKIPIACTLSATDAASRVERWRVALGTTVAAVSRPTPTRAELHVVAEPGAIATLVDLARQEKACCGFFGFAFEVDADGVRLVVSVPDDAVEVLDGFAGLAPLSAENPGLGGP